MKARFTFYFAAVVALVLFLACMQSHATERRDPLIIQDTPTTQAARSLNLVRSTVVATKSSQSSARKAKAANADKNHNGKVPAQTKDKSGANSKTPDAGQNSGNLQGGTMSGDSSR